MTESMDLFIQADAAYQQGDFKTAFTLFLKAAENGDINAMERLALMYDDGEGVESDIDKSIYWDSCAIANGSITALSNLAITYKQLGDFKKAEEYFKKAIKAGDYDAALELAKLYILDSEKLARLEQINDLLNIVIQNPQEVCAVSLEEAEKLLLDIQQNK